MSKKKLLIDTDAGIDDAQAILMALKRPDVEVVGITTCHGNTDADQVCRNVLRLLKMAERMDIPVYRGCNKPILGHMKDAAHYHGMDGFGDVPDPEAPHLTHAHKEHAITAMIRITNEMPGEVTLVALAPPTNIALALRMDPDFGRKLKACYMMGGNYEGKGNITPSAEFNFHADPEAAKVVLEELGCPLYLVCWELCLKHSLPWTKYDEFRSAQTLFSRFLSRIEAYTVKKCKELKWKTYILCDELPMAAAIFGNDVISECVTCYASVETAGHMTRAQMVVDWEETLHKPANVHIIRELNVHVYLECLQVVFK